MGLSSLIKKVQKIVEVVDVGSAITVDEVDPNFQFCFEKTSCYCFTKDCTVRIKGKQVLNPGKHSDKGQSHIGLLGKNAVEGTPVNNRVAFHLFLIKVRNATRTDMSET